MDRDKKIRTESDLDSDAFDVEEIVERILVAAETHFDVRPRLVFFVRKPRPNERVERRPIEQSKQLRVRRNLPPTLRQYILSRSRARIGRGWRQTPVRRCCTSDPASWAMRGRRIERLASRKLP